ncbi:MAG: GNAT family N-acetyltransferase [Chloroflexota bacterium]|nr:GNAT family N-acetyltransferase [Chloroflexota bacterium]MDE3192166.1 GNAT family N-acetyltransferase [Chloroflexota bacterium]
MTAAPLMPEIHVDENASADVVRAFFGHDRLLAAYALADLDPDNVDTARWWVARRGRDVTAAALLVEILPFRPCFAMGDTDSLASLFHELREQRLILAVPPRGRPAVEQTYRFERVDLMRRMAVEARAFLPRTTRTPTRLGPDQLEDLIELYGEASRSYFTARRLAREIYYGVYDGRRLVSAAGTHVRSSHAGIAAVGNVLTRIGHRDRGLATSVTSAVTEEALREHRDVVLNVRQENAPAIRVYERLGYHTHATFIEGPAVRRAPWERITNIWRRN